MESDRTLRDPESGDLIRSAPTADGAAVLAALAVADDVRLGPRRATRPAKRRGGRSRQALTSSTARSAEATQSGMPRP